MVKSRWLTISVALALLILAASLASAGVSVSGSKLEKDVAPGDHITHEIQIRTDDSDQPMDFQVDVFGIGQTDDGAVQELNASLDSSIYTARSFFKVSPVSFHLDPGKSQNVALEGDIPKDVGSGGRYALVKIHSLPIGKGMIGFVVGINIPIRLTINGSEIQNKGNIDSIDLIRINSSENKQGLSVLFKNTGNHHYYPILEAIVKDKNGGIVANASVPRGNALLPTYSRLFKTFLNPGSPLNPGIYVVNATLRMEDGTILATKETSIEVKS